MIVILKKDYGQLGNRLHTASNLLAWCLENKYSFINLSFQEYVSYYKPYKNHSIDKMFIKKSFLYEFLSINLINRFINRVVMSDKWLMLFRNWVLVIDRDDNDTISEYELNSFSTRAVLILRAWDIRCPNALASQQDTIRNIFIPKNDIISAIKDIKGYLPKHDFLVGLHARRGDYRSWENGKYYFSWKLYHKWLTEVKNILNKTHEVAFIICSDEKPPYELFNNFNAYISDQSAIFDLHLLSICDLHLGPPSSFGSWAQFHGSNKRICLYEKNQIISVSDF